MNFGGLRNRFKPSCIEPLKKKLTEALRIDKRRTTEGNMRVNVGECTLGVRQASVLRYIGIHPRHANVKHIALALSLHHTHLYLILHDLREKKLVQEQRWTESRPGEKGRPRKFYELTREGRAVIGGMRYLDAVEGRKMPVVPLPQERANGFSPGANQSEGTWVEWMQANA